MPIDTLILYAPVASDYSAMAPLESSRFHVTTQIEEHASHLMVENWGFNNTYGK